MRKLSTLLIAGIGLILFSCKKECDYQPITKGEEISNELMEKYVDNFNTFFNCTTNDTFNVSKLPPDNGIYVIIPDTMPCPPPRCRNPFLMCAVTSNSDSKLLFEGDTLIVLNSIKIKDDRITKDYYGFASTVPIIEANGILKVTLVNGKNSLVKHIKYEK